MQKTEGLAKAAAMMAILAALATRRGGLAVNVNPPAIKKERSTRGSEDRVQGIPAPPATPKGGVGPEHVGAGVAQGRGTAVERREASGGRAPVNASGTQQ
ncbi:MAG: hypothetical protein HY012_07400 [Acidobacteria bacterium]|nr:hypothetical protein [Acidobacteriota bacterium]